MHAIGTHLSVLTKVLLVSKLGAACMGTVGAEYTQVGMLYYADMRIIGHA